MLESIYLGMTGLLGYSRGLKVIANNTANMNTPGFKGSTLQFADLFYSNSNLGSGGNGRNYGQIGYGLDTKGTTLNFRQGELRQTSNDLDAAIDGLGLFNLKDDAGNIHYTRAGQFQFNDDGILVNRSDNAKVLGLDANGVLGEISLVGLRTHAGSATTTIKFSGNLSSSTTDQTVTGLKVIDAAGAEHALSLKFTGVTGTTPGTPTIPGLPTIPTIPSTPTTPGFWNVDLMDGTRVVGSGTIRFQDGKPDPATAKISMTYKAGNLAPIPITLDFSGDVTSFAGGTLSTLAVASQDGYGPGAMSKATFDADGNLVLTYSNGQTSKAARLALSRFDSLDAVTATGNNQFNATGTQAWQLGHAGADGFGAVRAGQIEISNVDLSQEFSDLVVMQRGYQSSSQVITTANEMLQELFSMKGK
ncbi:flagellar hook protein FlgE [Collimonas sp. OK412]|jgi:flagellar hook protein FlgE|uniref:flagellar hook protein FlgE n=1 Tax=Collimonas sp. (strain OK412) TaxID=1801619 RepID=UPI0008E0862D|nr:flagellar hook-basal body complex protein [Collimonas sp. OK412]SFC97492.1 flagellar hook protein FlgE [Collimonas sp. OK412]